MGTVLWYGTVREPENVKHQEKPRGLESGGSRLGESIHRPLLIQSLKRSALSSYTTVSQVMNKKLQVAEALT